MAEVTTKQVRSVIESIDKIKKYYNEKIAEQKQTDWKEYEEKYYERMACMARELKPIINRAYSMIKVSRDNNRGAKPKLSPKDKALFVVIQQIFGLSNRRMASMLMFFSFLESIPVISYKTIERAYSDCVVQLILHNAYVLLIKDKNISKVDLSGDGTGYSLSIKKHYADEKDKTKDRKDFVYYFTLVDLDTNMYVAYGVSRKSEKDAYNKALKILEELDIDVKSVRLDRLYSNDKTTKDFGRDVKFYLIPKKNATVRGSAKWKETMKMFVSDTYEYLGEYFRRNISESMFSSDKRLFGNFVRPDCRISSCLTAGTLIHNLFWMYG